MATGLDGLAGHAVADLGIARGFDQDVVRHMAQQAGIGHQADRIGGQRGDLGGAMAFAQLFCGESQFFTHGAQAGHIQVAQRGGHQARHQARLCQQGAGKAALCASQGVAHLALGLVGEQEFKIHR
ncbi:hypothetical protein D3C71_1685040 [compost metagenome]